MIRQVGEKEAREILSKGSLGYLGCVVDDGPYVVPVNYYFDGEHIYIHSLSGMKIDAMRKNPSACLQVDEIKDEFHWRSAIAFGKYEEITDETNRERALVEMFKHLPHLTPVESRMTRITSASIVFRLHIDRVTGVAEKW